MSTNDPPPPINRAEIGGRIITFIFGQPATTTMLAIIMVALSYGAWVGGPALLTKIQQGYDAMEVKHHEEVKGQRADLLKANEDQRTDLLKANSELRTDFKDAVRSASEQTTKALDRLSDQLDRRGGNGLKEP